MERSKKMIGWIIALTAVAGLGIAGSIGWSKLKREHEEARNLPLDAVDFSKLNDGAYHGAYAGGMYKWRANECDVTVAGGKVTQIQLAVSQDPGGKNTQHLPLYERVIQAQSLQVDTVSGATLTSKAYLKAVEDALVQAQQV
jgi:uncharacterized protein with FMN-binding domain